MLRLSCLWNRSRVEPFADGALGPRRARAFASHIAGCAACRGLADRQEHLSTLVRSSVGDPPDPDWSAFWPNVQSRLVREVPRPYRGHWWMPFWKPVWGHPRIAFGGAMAGALVLALSLWPGSEGQISSAWASPVVVQDVSSTDPEHSVMVYSTEDQGLTVIWLLPLGGTTEES